MARPRAPWRHFRSRSRTASSWWRSRSPRALASFRPDAAHGAHDLTGEILTSMLNKPDQKFRPTIERGRKPHDRTRTFLQSIGAAALLAVGISAVSAQMPQTIVPPSATPIPGPMPEVLQNYTPVTAERLKKPEDGNWFHFRRTYDGWGFSPLKEIKIGRA